MESTKIKQLYEKRERFEELLDSTVTAIHAKLDEIDFQIAEEEAAAAEAARDHQTDLKLLRHKENE